MKRNRMEFGKKTKFRKLEMLENYKCYVLNLIEVRETTLGIKKIKKSQGS